MHRIFFGSIIVCLQDSRTLAVSQDLNPISQVAHKHCLGLCDPANALQILMPPLYTDSVHFVVFLGISFRGCT